MTGGMQEGEMQSDGTSIASSIVAREPFGDAYLLGELASTLHALQDSYDALFRVNDDGQITLFPKTLCRYEANVVKLRQCLGSLHFRGRDHLIREIRHLSDLFHSSTFQLLCEAWIGTPGVEESIKTLRQHWTLIDQLITPSSEDALRQFMRHAVPSFRKDANVHEHEPVPKVLNFNVASAGAGAQAQQKTSQDLQQELKLAQTMELANSQETRFKALLKDLNSTAADLVSNIDQAQNLKQDIVDASQHTEQIINEIKAQNACAQSIANEIQRDRGLSRSLLTACAALAVCLGLPKLACLLPLLKRVPVLRQPAAAIEQRVQKRENSKVLANLIRERHIYKACYEAIREVGDIERHGNLFHKIAFGFLGINITNDGSLWGVRLGLGRVIDKKMEMLPPPSDVLSEEERWIDQRTHPHGTPQWTRLS